MTPFITQTTLRVTALLLSLACLASCDFHLRGAQLESLKQSPVYLNSQGAAQVAAEVRKQLLIAGIPLAPTPDAADYVITLSNETFDRSILSISPQTGKVEEYQLSYQVTMSVTGPGGQHLLVSEPITAERDYAFDEAAALGKFEEDATLRQDISTYAATAVMRRLEAITRQD